MLTAVRDQFNALSRQMLPLIGYLKVKTASHLKNAGSAWHAKLSIRHTI